MKTIKLLLFIVAFCSLGFYACSDSNPIEDNTDNAQKSIALRTVLNELKTNQNITGKADGINSFCFEFVWPMTFSFNNGTVITVQNFEGLYDILVNESPNLYLEGVVFPFQVMQAGAVITIETETEFSALVEACGFVTYNDDLENTYCFDIIFPITVGEGGQATTINTIQEFNAYLNGPNPGNEIQVIFPISVIYDNQTVVINNIYEFYEMTNNCDSCICTTEYAPVCVVAADGTIVEYGNTCHAECAGYTQNDLVACDPTNACGISGLTVTTGDCNTDGTYPLTINFNYVNPGSAQFEVYTSANTLLGTYDLTDLPLTIDNYPDATFATDYININIVGDPNCSISTQWTTPVCGDCGCPTEVSPVCVTLPDGTVIQFDNACLAACAGYTMITDGPCTEEYNFGTLLGTCFNMAYPVGIQYQGAITTVTSDGQLLQYWFPAQGPMPAFNYPVTVAFANATYTFANQADFEAQIAISCN